MPADVGKATRIEPAQAGAAPPSAFSGGLSGVMQAMQQIESGAQMLVQTLPSVAPVMAEFISKLRMVIPSALGADAGGQGIPGVPGAPAITGGQSLPTPPPMG